jgi:hypothetical protein
MDRVGGVTVGEGLSGARGIGTVVPVIQIEAMAGLAAAYAQWITPDLPLYGNDHERGDLAP